MISFHKKKNTLIFNEEEGEYDLPDDEEEPEAGDEEEGDDPDEEPEDTSGDDEGEDDSDEEEESGEEDEEEGGEGEYDLEDTDDEEGEESDDESDDTPDDEEDEGKTELQKLEDELFKDLTEEQKTVRDKELISNFLELYRNTNIMLLKLEKIKSGELRKIRYVSNRLIDLRRLIYAYIMNTFHEKSYIENNKIYHEMLAVMTTLTEILKNIKEEQTKDEQ